MSEIFRKEKERRSNALIAMTDTISRRELLKYGTAAAACAAFGNPCLSQGKLIRPNGVVVVMFDGFDPGYLAESKMPVLGQWKRDGTIQASEGRDAFGYQRQ